MKDETLTPKSWKGNPNMEKHELEQVEYFMTSYEQRIRRELKESITHSLCDERDKIDRLLNSDVALDLYYLAHGERFIRLFEKRQKLHIKWKTLTKAITTVWEC